MQRNATDLDGLLDKAGWRAEDLAAASSASIATVNRARARKVPGRVHLEAIWRALATRIPGLELEQVKAAILRGRPARRRSRARGAA